MHRRRQEMADAKHWGQPAPWDEIAAAVNAAAGLRTTRPGDAMTLETLSEASARAPRTERDARVAADSGIKIANQLNAECARAPPHFVIPSEEQRHGR